MFRNKRQKELLNVTLIAIFTASMGWKIATFILIGGYIAILNLTDQWED